MADPQKASSYDAIVIGGGLGGLAAAAVLAHTGKRVLVIEKHTALGGYASSFRRMGYCLEVAMHAMDGNASKKTDIKYDLFSLLRLRESLQFVRSPELYRYIGPELDLVIPDDVEQARAMLSKQFPHDKNGIEEYFNLLTSAVHDPVDVFVTHQNHNVGEMFDQLFTDENLKMALACSVHYYHDDPYTLSLPFYAIAQGGYYLHGNYFVSGGSQALSGKFASVITSHGGVILLGQEVIQIMVEQGRATGVRYKNVKTGEEGTALGDAIIANAPVLQVINRLLPPDSLPASFLERLNQMEPSMSALSVYICLNKTPSQFGVRTFNTILCEELHSLADLSMHQDTHFKQRILEVTNYQQTDTGINPPQKPVLSLVMSDNLSYWESLPSKNYKKQKEEIGKMLIDRCERHFPGLAASCEYSEVGTPKTMERYTSNDFGSIYGFALTPNQAGSSRPSTRSPIPNLFFASGWCYPGGGMSGAMLAGYLAARQVINSILMN